MSVHIYLFIYICLLLRIRLLLAVYSNKLTADLKHVILQTMYPFSIPILKLFLTVECVFPVPKITVRFSFRPKCMGSMANFVLG